jgi:uncharacterized protein (TIGR03437 family)
LVVAAAFEAGYQPPGPAPRLAAGGAVNAASSAPFLTPGSLASVYGENLSNTTASATTLPLPTSLERVSFRIGGLQAPLLFVSPGQVNLQVPWEVAPGATTVTASLNGVPGNTISATVRAASPGVFIVVHNSDGAPVSAARPAGDRDVLILYATGLGDVTESVSTGGPAPGSLLAYTRETPVVRLGDRAAEVLFSGLAPGFVGLYQLNVQLPAGITPGSVPLVVTVGGQASPPVMLPTR